MSIVAMTYEIQMPAGNPKGYKTKTHSTVLKKPKSPAKTIAKTKPKMKQSKTTTMLMQRLEKRQREMRKK